jgi:hypothetical protein
LGEVIRYGRRDECSVGKEGDEKPFLLGIGIDLEKIPAGKNFPPGVEKPQAARLRDFVNNLTVFLEGEFALKGLLFVQRKVVIAVNAGQVTARGQFNGSADGGPLRQNPPVKFQTPVFICLTFHILSA